jgi:hypothetical protein
MEMQPPTSRPREPEPDLDEVNGSLPAPPAAATALQKWNNPQINMFRVFATFYSFVILGLNDVRISCNLH